MEHPPLTPDTTFPYLLFRFAHRRSLDSVSSSYFAIVSKDNNPVGLVLSIDIDERWHHARAAATTYWQIFVREFTHSESRSTLTRFEEALKELNKAIIKTRSKIKEVISVAAMVLESNQIHFSTVGTSRVLLIRDGKLNDVTAGSDKNDHQFAAVTSGDLDGTDTVAVANQNIYEFFAAEPDELWQITDASALSREIHSRSQNSDQALNCTIVQYNPDQSIQTTLYWEESEKQYPIEIGKFFRKLLPKRLNLPILVRPKLPAFRWPNLSLSLPKTGRFSIKLPRLTSLTSLTKRWLALSPKRLVVAAVLIAALAIAVFFVLRPGSGDRTITEGAMSVSEEFSALSEADSLPFLENLASSGKFNELSDDELASIVGSAKQRGIGILIEQDGIAELPEPAVAVSQVNGELFLADSSGQLWQFGGSGQLKKIDHLYKIAGTQSLVAFSNESVLVGDNLGNLWHYSGKADGPVALPLPSPLNNGQKLIGRFGNNLYLYSPAQNAVYRQVNFSDSITSSSPYFGLSALNNRRLMAWAINGDFIVLTDEPALAGVLRNQVTLAPQTIERLDENSRVSSDRAGLIVIASGHRLEGYDGEGQLLWQKFLLAKEPFGDIAAAGTKLWATAGQTLFSIAL